MGADFQQQFRIDLRVDTHLQGLSCLSTPHIVHTIAVDEKPKRVYVIRRWFAAQGGLELTGRAVNKDRRKAIDAIKLQIADMQMRCEQLAQEVLDLAAEEQEYFDNMPESLQGTDRGQAAEQAISELEDVASSLGSIDFDEIITGLEAAAT